MNRTLFSSVATIPAGAPAPTVKKSFVRTSTTSPDGSTVRAAMLVISSSPPTAISTESWSRTLRKTFLETVTDSMTFTDVPR